jgi:hypothetical protein
VWRVLRRLLRRDGDFSSGDRVVFVEDGTTGIVNVSEGGYSHVHWEDEQPMEDFGGSRVPNSKLRRLKP